MNSRIVAAFHDCSLPASEWTHESHLRVCVWYLRRFSPDAALPVLRDAIRRYNTATGVPNSDTRGYHDTLTRFWIAQVAAVVSGIDDETSDDAVTEAVIRACVDRRLPLRHWSEGVLMSTGARRAWVPPDVAPLTSVVDGLAPRVA